ncbi:MAG TPA: hypothetical protein VNA14_03035, partial [Mycobacteriales bacterium]|nr:hypothetical protein [Mycobacteriales bacterium]
AGSRAHFDVTAEVDDGVMISVRNHGSWRERRAGIGGRGLAMAEHYSDRVDIVRGDTEVEVRLHRGIAAAPSVPA